MDAWERPMGWRRDEDNVLFWPWPRRTVPCARQRLMKVAGFLESIDRVRSPRVIPRAVRWAWRAGFLARVECRRGGIGTTRNSTPDSNPVPWLRPRYGAGGDTGATERRYFAASGSGARSTLARWVLERFMVCHSSTPHQASAVTLMKPVRPINEVTA